MVSTLNSGGEGGQTGTGVGAGVELVAQEVSIVLLEHTAIVLAVEQAMK